MTTASTPRSLPLGLSLQSTDANPHTGRWVAALVIAFLAGAILPDVRTQTPTSAPLHGGLENWHGNVINSQPGIY